MSTTDPLADALLRLANAADEVGVACFDSDDLPACVVNMQAATEAARLALAAQGQTQPVAWLLDGTHHVEFDPQPYHAGSEWVPLYGSPLYAAPQAVPAVPPGMVLVPLEPTLHMIVAGGVALIDASQRDLEATSSELKACYRAMIAARPQAEPTPTDTST